jgi:hypothetical protein
LEQGVALALVVLFFLVLLSLGSSGYLLWQWLGFRSQTKALAQKALTAIAGSRQELRGLDHVTFEHLLRIDQTLPIDVVIPFREQLEVPVQTMVPVDQSIETSFSLQLPGFSVRVPVDLVIPVRFDVPIDMTVPVEVNRDLPVSTTVPIKLEVPLVIDLADTELQRYVGLIDQGLAGLEQELSAVGA